MGHSIGSSIFVGIIGLVFWIGVKLPIMACIIAGKVAVFLLQELLSGGYRARLHAQRAYLTWKRDH